MVCRTEKKERQESAWDKFENLLPANNNVDPHSSPEAHVLKRRLEVLQAVERKVKDMTATRAPDPHPSELVLRVIQIRMNKLKSGFREFEAVS